MPDNNLQQVYRPSTHARELDSYIDTMALCRSTLRNNVHSPPDFPPSPTSTETHGLHFKEAQRHLHLWASLFRQLKFILRKKVKIGGGGGGWRWVEVGGGSSLVDLKKDLLVHNASAPK